MSVRGTWRYFGGAVCGGLRGIDLRDEVWVPDNEIAGEGLREGCEHGAGGHYFVVDLCCQYEERKEGVEGLTRNSLELVSMHSFKQVARKST